MQRPRRWRSALRGAGTSLAASRSMIRTSTHGRGLGILRPALAAVLFAGATVACKPDRAAEVQHRVEAALRGEPGLQSVSVAVDRGIVTLTGVVDSDGDRVHVDARARAVPGVVDVDDRLLLPAPPTLSGATPEAVLAASVEASLRAQDFLHLDVSVHHEVVRVTGNVRADRRADAMRVVVAGVPRGYRVEDASVVTDR